VGVDSSADAQREAARMTIVPISLVPFTNDLTMKERPNDQGNRRAAPTRTKKRAACRPVRLSAGLGGMATNSIEVSDGRSSAIM
jgi:hypothetical protein